MWMFDIISGRWTWLSGAETVGQVGVYGTQGIETSSNRPGGRTSLCVVMHPAGQLMFLFGGNHYSAESQGMTHSSLFDSIDYNIVGILNDMWQFLCPVVASDAFVIDYPSNDATQSSDRDTHLIVTRGTLKETNSPSSPPTSKNFWIDYTDLALTIMVISLLTVFQFGFIIGFVYEGRKHNLRHEYTDASSIWSKNTNEISTNNSFSLNNARSHSFDDTETSSQFSSIVAPSIASRSTT